MTRTARTYVRLFSVSPPVSRWLHLQYQPTEQSHTLKSKHSLISFSFFVLFLCFSLSSFGRLCWMLVALYFCVHIIVLLLLLFIVCSAGRWFWPCGTPHDWWWDSSNSILYNLTISQGTSFRLFWLLIQKKSVWNRTWTKRCLFVVRSYPSLVVGLICARDFFSFVLYVLYIIFPHFILISIFFPVARQWTLNEFLPCTQYPEQSDYWPARMPCHAMPCDVMCGVCVSLSRCSVYLFHFLDLCVLSFVSGIFCATIPIGRKATAKWPSRNTKQWTAKINFNKKRKGNRKCVMYFENNRNYVQIVVTSSWYAH